MKLFSFSYILRVHGFCNSALFTRLNYFIKKQCEQFCDLNSPTIFPRNYCLILWSPYIPFDFSCSMICIHYLMISFFFVHGNCRKYSGVRKWTLGLSGGKDQIAVIRASGSISRVRGPLSVPGSGIIAEQFIEKIRNVRGIHDLAITIYLICLFFSLQRHASFLLRFE